MQQNNIKSDVSSAVKSQLGYTDIIEQLKDAIRTDIMRLEYLAKQGIITQQQGQILLDKLVGKARALDYCKQNISQDAASAQTPSNEQEQSPLDLFNSENPDFFAQEGRSELLDYIKGTNVDKDEISKIAHLAETLEKAAVENYLKKSEHDKNLSDENSIAKSRLTAYSQNATPEGKFAKIFTREDIGKMSGDEFAKNEKLIMEQVKQGLIK